MGSPFGFDSTDVKVIEACVTFKQHLRKICESVGPWAEQNEVPWCSDGTQGVEKNITIIPGGAMKKPCGEKALKKWLGIPSFIQRFPGPAFGIPIGKTDSY